MKKYIHTVSAFQFFHIARYTTLVLTSVVFAKSAITQDAIGEYETFIFLAGAISFFWLNGLLKALLPLSSEDSGSGTCLFSAFILISAFSILASLFLYSFYPLFSEILLNGKNIPELFLLIVYIVFGVPAGLTEYFYLIKKKSNALIIYAIISFSVQFFLVVIPVVLRHSVKLAMTGLVISSLFRYIWLWVVLIKNNEIHFSFSFFKTHIKLGAPLIAATFLSGSAQFIDGFIVTSRYDESIFAVFRYGARELPLATLLANALSNALLPDFGRKENLKANLEVLKRNVLKLMHLLFPLSAILLMISYPLFPIIFNPEFSESATIFNIYLLLIISRLLMPQTILTGLKYTRTIMYASFFELVINISLSLFLVGIFGIVGVAYATVLAYLSEKVYLIIILRRKLNIRISEYHPVRYYIFYSIIVVFVFIIVTCI